MRLKFRDLTPDELEAVTIFATDFGRGWKEKLNFTYWYNARLYRSRNGKEYPILHRLRNELGPSWLAGFKLPRKGDRIVTYVAALAELARETNLAVATLLDVLAKFPDGKMAARLRAKLEA